MNSNSLDRVPVPLPEPLPQPPVNPLMPAAAAAVMPVPLTPPTGAEGFGADIDEAAGAAVGTGAMTICAILKLDGAVAVVVMALTGELLTGVAVTETS